MVPILSPGRRWRYFTALIGCLSIFLAIRTVAGHAQGAPESPPRFVDLSLLVSADYPCIWPTFPPFQINHYERIGPLSPYRSEILIIDGNTGTQLDVPPHSVTPRESGFSNAGEFGRTYTDVVPAWQFGGEACVIDCGDLRDNAPFGQSSLIKRERVIAWEKQHRLLGPGDVVLFKSGYSDAYYKPLPQGRRYAADPLAKRSPAWPDPDPECVEYLAERKVMALGTDSASMGPLVELAEPTHFAGLKRGMIWTESATGLGALPPTGAFYCILSPKYGGGAYGEGRAFAVIGDPLARRLIDSARQRKVIDLSVVLSDELPVSWPGSGVGHHRQPFVTIKFGFNPNTRLPFDMHMLDSHSGTHLVPPSYALPEEGFDDGTLAPEVGEWLGEYEKRYGRRGSSDVTTDKVPIEQTCGRARVIDVRHLAGKSDAKMWPFSPEITVALIENDEKEHGELRPGDVVVFHTAWTDRFMRPLPLGKACLEDPLNGASEGWPAPGPDAIVYLAGKGVRCVATDAPTLGGVEPKRALETYWALGGKGMAGVESLTNVGQMPRDAYFLFAAVKIKGGHGGHGRAIALY
jgi:kynurenine formamidase